MHFSGPLGLVELRIDSTRQAGPPETARDPPWSLPPSRSTASTSRSAPGMEGELNGGMGAAHPSQASHQPCRLMLRCWRLSTELKTDVQGLRGSQTIQDCSRRLCIPSWLLWSCTCPALHLRSGLTTYLLGLLNSILPGCVAANRGR